MRYLFICLIACISCQTVLKKAYGIRQPKLEEATQLNAFLSEVGVQDTTNSYYCRDTAALLHVLKLSGGLPDVLSFNKDGLFVSYKENEAQCNGKVSEFISKKENFEPATGAKDTLTVTKLQQLITPVWMRGEDKGFGDGVVFIVWSKWIGKKLNRDKVAEWATELKSAASGVGVAFINLDYMKVWGITVDDIPEYGL